MSNSLDKTDNKIMQEHYLLKLLCSKWLAKFMYDTHVINPLTRTFFNFGHTSRVQGKAGFYTRFILISTILINQPTSTYKKFYLVARAIWLYKGESLVSHENFCRLKQSLCHLIIT